jgi:predicted transcriptional regulator
MSIFPVQSKMARAALGWSAADLAKHAQVGVATVNRFEAGQSNPIPSTIAAMKRAMEEAGVEFTNGEAPGVRLHQQDRSDG